MTKEPDQLAISLIQNIEAENVDLENRLNLNRETVTVLKRRLGYFQTTATQPGIEQPDQKSRAGRKASADSRELEELVRQAIQVMGAKFSPTDLFELIESQSPGRFQKAPIYTIVRKMTENGLLVQVQEGSGKRPALYSLTTNLKQEEQSV